MGSFGELRDADDGGPSRRRLAALAGALTWLGALAIRLASVPEGSWRWRDDAVITLSHARGWAVDGSIGVSTSGARVEGFSTPLQFGLASVYYRLGFSRFEMFLDAQVVLAVLCAGYFAVRLAQAARPVRRWWAGVAVAGTAAVVAMVPWASSGWMASGMEESLAVAATMATAAGLVRLAQGEGRLGGALYAGTAIAVLGVTRVEFPILIVPVVALAVAVSIRASRWRAAVAAAIPLGTWAVVNLARHWYFGSFSPNTILAEQKAPTVVVRSWIPAGVAFVVVVAVLSGAALGLRRFRASAPVDQEAWAPDDPRTWAAGLAIGTVAALGVRALVDPEAIPTPLAWDVVRDSFSSLGLIGLLLLLVAVLMVSRRRLGIAEAALGLLAVVPMVQLAIAGGARLDPVRIAGLAIPPLALLVALITSDAVSDIRVRYSRRAEPARPGIVAGLGGKAAGLGVLALVGAGAWFVTHPAFAEARVLCCAVAPLDEVIATRAREQRDATGLPVVIVANPDLGKLSHRREFEMVDLGLLGDPLLTRLARYAPELRDRYLLDVATPDVVELHPGFTCEYDTWTSSPAFRARYRQVEERAFVDDLDPTCVEPVHWHIFERTLDDPDYRTEVELAKRLADPEADAVTTIRRSLDRCAAGAGDAFRCEYVRRASSRNRVALQASGRWDDIVASFATSPAAALDHALLTADSTPAWQNTAFTALRDIASGRGTPR